MQNGYESGVYPQERVNPAMLAGAPLSTCVVLADSRAAQIYMRHQRVFNFVTELKQDVSAVNGKDKRARGDQSFDHGGAYGNERHRYEAGIGVSRQEETLLAHDLAHWLEKQLNLKAFKALVLVASPVMLGEIRKVLSRPVANTIIAESSKQLQHYKGAALNAELLKLIPGPDCEKDDRKN